MNRRQTTLFSCVVLLAFLAPGTSLAQQEPARRGGRAGAGASQVLTPAELERWLDSYVLLQAQDAVKVSEGQFPRFLQRLRALQTVRRQNAVARRQLLGTLGRLTNAASVDEEAVKDRLKALRELDLKAAEDLRRAYDALDEVLDPVQQARFRVFEQVVERRQIELLTRARARAGDIGKQPPAPMR